MNIVEVIRIRLSQEPNKEIVSQIHEYANNLGLENFSIYRHYSVETDMTIHLHHQTSILKVSEKGKTLATLLKELGLVNHSVWVEFDSENINELVSNSGKRG